MGKNSQNRQILDGDFTRENLWLWKSRIPSWERQNKSTLVAGFNHFENLLRIFVVEFPYVSG